MMVLDTCILSEVFRKKPKPSNQNVVDTLRQMIEDDWPLVIPGIVFQEFLTGFRQDSALQHALDVISGFRTIYADQDDHVLAAHIKSTCHKKGVQCAAIDALIAATTINLSGRLLTIDKDFSQIGKHCHLKLFVF